MPTSPISGKSLESLTSEAVDAGASLEDIQAATKNAEVSPITDVQEPQESNKHVPVGDEFKEENADLATTVATEEEVAGEMTEHGRSMEHMKRNLQRQHHEAAGPVEAGPTFWQSAAWSANDFGVVGNTARWIAQATDIPDPEAQVKITKAMPELMYGVSEEYEEYIQGQPNFEAAEREADRLRTQEFREVLRGNEGIGQSITAGITGFVADPINLVPGGFIVKGMSMSAKLASAAGLRGVVGTTMSKKAMTWGAAGAVEELVRAAPRLASDQTYMQDQYLTDAALTMAFGAGMPIAGAGIRLAGTKASAAVREVVQFGEAMGLDQAVRTTADTARRVSEQTTGADGGLMEKFRAMDLSTAAKEAREKTKQVVEDQLRNLREVDVSVPIAEAVDKADLAGVVAANQDWLNKVAEKLRTLHVPKEGEDATKMFEAPDLAPVEQKLDAGAQKRKTTTADVVEDVKSDLRQTARTARLEMKRATEAAQKMLDEANISDDARNNMQFFLERIRYQNEEAIDLALTKRGIRPQRNTLNNKDHTAATKSAVFNVNNVAGTVFKRLGATVADLPLGFNMGKRGNFLLTQAYKHAGISAQRNETLTDAYERTVKGMSHTQRKTVIARLDDALSQNFEAMKYDLDAHPTLTPAQVNALSLEIDAAAQQVSQQMDLAKTIASNPYEDAVVTQAQWSQISAGWRESADMAELERQFVDNKTQSLVKHQFGKLTESLSTRLIKSGAPIAQWFTHNVLETPAGFGGKMDRNPLTAVIHAENLDNQARRPMLLAWETMMRETADAENWSWIKRVFNKQGNARTHSDVTRLSKEVQLEMNARHFGTTSTASPAVKKFASQLDESYSGLHDLQNGHVKGIHDKNKISGYQHQVWDDQKILDLLGQDVGRKGVTDLFRQGYLQAGLPIEKASILAKAMVDQKVSAAARPRGTEFNFGEEQLKGMMPELADVVDRMRKNNTSEEIILEITDHINKAAKGDTPGYAKARVPIDLNAQAVINGQTIKVVDLMDNDVPGIFTRYSKEATARRAISESTGGVLNSDKAMHEMMVNMSLEAQELGANVDTRAVRNALGMMMGKAYDGQLPMDARRARDAVALAGMGGLGESQLAEFGLAINRGLSGAVGAMQKFRVAGANVNKKWRGIELTPEQATDKVFLSELQEASGLYGDMHLIDRRNVHFDAKEAEYKGLSRVVDTATGGKFRPLLQHMQTRYTGYGVIRQFEDQIAMASMTQDIAKQLSGRKAFTSPERFRDLGVDLAEDGWLATRFRDTVTYKDDGTVEALNLHQWSDMDRNKFGVIMNRYSSQQVQKGFVGESSPEMMNPWVSFLMQFKSYPMLAAEKQQARHLKFADKEAAMGTVLNAASSGASRAIRYHSMATSIADDREREAYLDEKFKNFNHDTLAYMGGVGMMVNIHDIGNGMLFEGESVADQIPVLNYADSYLRAMKGPLDGDISSRDVRNMQNAAHLGTIGQANLLFRIIQEGVDGDAASE